MTNKLFFLINPVAGNRKAKKIWPVISDALKQRGIEFDFEFTKCKGDAIIIAKAARIKNYKCYISVGGDGTFHEMINGLLTDSAIPPTVFILPIGSGNDFVRTHKIPKWSPEWLQILDNFHSQLHNAGMLNYQEDYQEKSRIFINVAGLFYDGYIVRAASIRTNPISSSIQYLGMIFKHLFTYKPPKAIIKWEKEQRKGSYYTANIGVAKYSGGGMRFVPHADPFGKDFAITLAKHMHPIRVLLSTNYFYNGKIAKHRKITCFHTDKITIDPLEDEILVEADGEFLGNAPCSLELILGAFRLVRRI